MKTTTDRCTGTQMFGCFESELEAYVGDRDTYDLATLAQSILSDAQAQQELGDHEAARQFMNRAKYVLNKIRQAHR